MVKAVYASLFTLLLSGCATQMPTHTSDYQARFFTLIDTLNKTPQTRLTKVEILSASLLSSPYLDGGLGEGQQGHFDQDPLMRFDAFDCTTYVETVLAGAMSPSATDFLPNLNHLRYHDGEISFITRNHFPSVDWLPNNQGVLKDITSRVAQSQTQIANTTIDKRAWYQAMTESRIHLLSDNAMQKATRLKALKKAGQRFVPEPVGTPYVPLTALFHSNASEQTFKVNKALLKRIPSGSVISMVRPDYNVKKWIGTNMNITHQSIAIRKHGTLYLRHASLVKNEVVDENFVEYFAKYRTSPTLKGFNVQALNF